MRYLLSGLSLLMTLFFANAQAGFRMDAEEETMLREINAVRTNPAAYVPYVRSYIETISMDNGFGDFYKQEEIATANELITELERTAPMRPLQGHAGLYEAARKHGLDLQRMGSVTHTGSDGSQPWDRIQQYANFPAGSENIVSGGNNARESLIILLVDSGVPSRGHRKNILNPKWEYAAAFQVNEIAGMPNGWVQVFGQSGGNSMGSSPMVQDATNSQTPNSFGNTGRERLTERGTTGSTKPSPTNAGSSNYMSDEEQEMLNEINLLRGNPAGYAAYVEQYLTDYRNSGWPASIVAMEEAAARELIGELRQTPALSILQPHPGLLQAAQVHATDLQRSGRVSHTGSDGSQPWDRIERYASFPAGSENIAAGGDDIRQSVIMLLVDSGIPGRGHRKNLLNPKWTHAAGAHVSEIDGMPNGWVQVFGKGDASSMANANEGWRSTGSPSATNPMTPSENSGLRNTTVENSSANTVNPQNSTTEPAPTPPADERVDYLATDEQEMVREINRLRSNPAGYVPLVKQYLNNYRSDGWDEYSIRMEEAAAQELINELQQTSPMRTLHPHPGLFKAAQTHALDLQRMRSVSHTGSDGSQPWDRIERFASFPAGSENIAAGGDDVRQSVIMLLVDSGVPGRGHRKNLLNPKWTHVAAAHVSEIDGMPNGWVQVFGKSDKPVGSAAPAGEMASSLGTPTTPIPLSFENTGTEQFSDRGSTTSNTPMTATPATNEPLAGGADFMNDQERVMVDEINRMRSNPAGYVKHVEAYLEAFRSGGWDANTVAMEQTAAQELIAELRQLSPLPTLDPYAGLQTVAEQHGAELQRRGVISHMGNDGSWPWDRIRRTTDLNEGTENIVGGGKDVRESVIMLLVDSGIPNRGHRKALLDPRWSYVGISNVGNIADYPNSFVQVFGTR